MTDRRLRASSGAGSLAGAAARPVACLCGRVTSARPCARETGGLASPARRRAALLAIAALFALAAGLGGCSGKSGAVGEPAEPPLPAPAGPGPRRTPAPSPDDAWKVPDGVTPRRWRYIVIHHSGTDEGSAAAFDRYHRDVKGWKDLAYHFVIGNGRGTGDGAVEAGPRWKEQRAGAHAGAQEYNDYGIGICLVGNFETSVPTRRQREVLARLLRHLMERFAIPAGGVKRHCDVVQTKCPGRRFPWPVAPSTE